MESLYRDDHYSKLKHLQDQIHRLARHVVQHGAYRLAKQPAPAPPETINKSIVNLAHYLALREIDLRPLQEELAEAGLSSLGRAEAHVFANLSNIINILGEILGDPLQLDPGLPWPGFREGFEILDQNSDQALGASPANRMTRIMVTLSSDTAHDYRAVYDLIREGMNIARINCAHDNPFTWRLMIKHVRQANRELHSSCRVLMDLAGHKIRTGQIRPAADSTVFRYNRKSSASGRAEFAIVPVRLANEPTTREPDIHNTFIVPDAIFSQLAEDDRLCFVDAKGKRRHVTIATITQPDFISGFAHKNIRLLANTVIEWQRLSGDAYKTLQSFHYPEVNNLSGNIRLHAGDVLQLHKQSDHGHPTEYGENGELLAPASIGCTAPEVIDILEPGAPVWFDDGKIGARVIQKFDDYLILRITRAGPAGAKLKPDKGLNFPGTKLNLPSLTAKDRMDLDFICLHSDMVGFSFIETADDMHELIAELASRNSSDIPVVAKIETTDAVKNLPDILFASMLSTHPFAVMIARGDLAVELGSVRMAEIQEEILWLCEAAHVPVIWATQVMESIAKTGVRSRPEFTDAAMSVRAECVMLNKGSYILDALRSLSAVLKIMQNHQRKKISRLRALHW
ncbi:pyruvate kinase [Thiohalophilus sp.]|uniref:pyruvate kinase n=1 Tax=Thiohalophilus sp. TaxID=3028392 RepID=UPI00397608AB